MFKVQHKRGPKAKWADAQNGKRFATEETAWAYVASLDQDGHIDRTNNRVVAA
ncbi:MAG: hypothetical protein Q7V17_15020 [Afipia sp.]|nr:hypothetical protein [Afipia sp.]